MGILSTILTVFFVILCFFLVILVLLQTDKSSGMGLLGGSSQSTFGSSTADVVSKITAVMVALFFIIGIALAVIETVNVRELKKGLTDVKYSEVKASEASTDKPASGK